MSTDSFNWKSLFFNNDTKETEKKESPIPSSFPEENRFPGTPTHQVNTQGTSNNPYIDEIFGIYQSGFESLNMAGFDFFEMYKSVVSVGATNPQSYQMAFTMGKTIQSDLTKDFLIEKSQFYIDEIEKVYQKNDSKGKAKKTELDGSVTRNKVSLMKSVSDLEIQIEALQKELASKKHDLSQIDTVSQSEYSEIQMKIEANDIAKKKIVDSINLVLTGIKQYL